MGPGLTPSGDDFLAGFICAGVVLGKDFPLSAGRSEGLARLVLKEAWTRSPCVGVSMIEDASEGLMSEPVRSLMESILFSADAAEVERNARKLVSLGASSGVDLLNGLVCGAWFFDGFLDSNNSDPELRGTGMHLPKRRLT